MKKRFMRTFSLIMAFVMTMAMCVTGFAADDTEKYSISIENSIGEVTYNVYKIFDVTYSSDGSAMSYTIDSSSPWFGLMNSDSTCPFTFTKAAGSDNTYVVTAKTGTTEATVGAWFNALEDLPDGVMPAAEAVKGNGETVTFELSEAGYYLVIPESDMYDPAAVSLTTAAPTAVIVDKNQAPGEGGEGKNLTKAADGESFSIGDEIGYTVTSYVPTCDGADKVTDYTITDTMSAGLTLIADLGTEPDAGGNYTVNSGVKVEIKGTGLTDYEDITDECIITFSYDGPDVTVLTVTWKIEDVLAEGLSYPADALVQITYKDLANEASDDEDMKNAVALSWNKITPEGPEEGETPDHPEVIVYTYGFDLKKTDGTGETAKVLEGAEFTLQKTGSTDLISFIYDKETDTYEEYDGHTLDAGESTTTTIVAADGEINIWGLGAGTYTLTETAAPAGYNLLESPVTVVIEKANNGWNVAVTINGVTTNSVGAFSSAVAETDEHGVAVMPTVTIVNNAGTILPGTGGIGTTIFYIAGAALLLAAAAFAVTKWRLGRSE